MRVLSFVPKTGTGSRIVATGVMRHLASVGFREVDEQTLQQDKVEVQFDVDGPHLRSLRITFEILRPGRREVPSAADLENWNGIARDLSEKFSIAIVDPSAATVLPVSKFNDMLACNDIMQGWKSPLRW